MKKAVVVLFIASLVVGAGFAQAQSVAEQSNTAREVERTILESFEASNKSQTTRPEEYSREGALEFWSNAGMLNEVGPDGGQPSRYEIRSLTPKHIKVLTLLEGQAAVAHYYSEGALQPEGSPATPHYLTRVTQVFVKEDGEWKVRSTHWSPLEGGGGTSQAAEAKPEN
jgi:hypothetical protein